MNLKVLIIDVRCSMRSYVISPSCAILLSKQIHYNGDDDSALCDDGSALLDLRWLNVCNGCRVGPSQTMMTLCRVIQIYRNGDDGPALLGFGWLNVFNGFRIAVGRTVCTFACIAACVLEFESVNY